MLTAIALIGAIAASSATTFGSSSLTAHAQFDYQAHSLPGYAIERVELGDCRAGAIVFEQYLSNGPKPGPAKDYWTGVLLAGEGACLWREPTQRLAKKAMVLSKVSLQSYRAACAKTPSDPLCGDFYRAHVNKAERGISQTRSQMSRDAWFSHILALSLGVALTWSTFRLGKMVYRRLKRAP